jgi:hypothetical protein
MISTFVNTPCANRGWNPEHTIHAHAEPFKKKFVAVSDFSEYVFM